MKNNKGFGLIEFIVALAIIGILAAIYIPQFVAFKKRQELRSQPGAVQSLHTECQTIVKSPWVQRCKIDGRSIYTSNANSLAVN